MRASYSSGETVSLAGDWQFELDPGGVGVEERWFDRELADTIRLPGSTNEREKAPPDVSSGDAIRNGGATAVAASGEESPSGDRTGRVRDRLTQRYPFEGAAWYRRTVEVPESWSDSRLSLTIERTRRTTLWIDGERVGTKRSLSTPQVYDLTGVLDPGEHTVTIRVDNDAPPLTYDGVRRSHAASEHTQTNWNGMIGDVELSATDPVWIDRLRFDSRPDAGRATISVTVGNLTGTAVSGHLDFRARALDGDYAAPPETMAFETDDSRTSVELQYDLGEDPPRWDEFAPNRIGLTVSLVATAGGTDYTDGETTTVGLRTVGTDGTQFVVNGRTTFVRGTVDCCVFPETGYPATDEETWRSRLETVREYGLNFVRFHSWCPPEAAFEAADELGLYLQPELPLWNNGGAFEDDDAAAFFRDEARRILDAYGDHPSFLAFALGNELAGDDEAMADLVESLRERDDRRLYAAGAYNGLSDSTYSSCDDFWTTASVPVDPNDPGGERYRVRATRAHLEDEPPSTDEDYTAAVGDVPVPIVAHETGQFQVYPDFLELQKYDGALRPDNLEVARNHLEAHGMLDRAPEFGRASGKLAVRCYREEVEAALRTPGFGGFELLSLQDFPGQGTALVGLLDSFMDPKGLVDPAEWRSFCSPVVPLVRTDSRIFTTDETLEATTAVANYGPNGAPDVDVDWRLDVDGESVTSGSTNTDLPQGELVEVDDVAVSLSDVDAPARATLTASVPRLEASAGSDVWLFPPEGPAPGDDDGVRVRRAFDQRTRDLLADGEDVLLVPDHDDLAHSYEGQFQPAFWSYSLFKRRALPGTLGPVFDPDHPAMAAFPTADHADWQWWRLLKNARPVVLDDAPDDYRPIVGMVDNVARNHALGLVFETAVGDGGLLVSTVDLFACADHPTGRQLYESLASYVRSAAFDPDSLLSRAVLGKLLGG